jgi:hypothetical protein
MGYRYSAHVTFPLRAVAIDAISRWINDETRGRETVIDCQTQTIKIVDHEASNGEIEVTMLLDEHHVPHDHYHSDDCAGSPEPHTVYVRFAADGTRVAREVTERDLETAILGEELREVLNSGHIDALRARLDSLIAKGPKEMVDELAPDWQLPAAIDTSTT